MFDSATSRTFSAFWPLFILFVTLVSLQAISVFRTMEHQGQLKIHIEQMAKVEAEAKKVDVVLAAVSRDLLTLAEKNTNALRVVTDFQIRQNATNALAAPSN